MNPGVQPAPLRLRLGALYFEANVEVRPGMTAALRGYQLRDLRRIVDEAWRANRITKRDRDVELDQIRMGEKALGAKPGHTVLAVIASEQASVHDPARLRRKAARKRQRAARKRNRPPKKRRR